MGDPTLSKSESSLKTLGHDFKQEGSCFIIIWGQIEEPVDGPVLREILATLEENDEVFQDPEGLSPSRQYDHSIHLQEEAAIPNLRPYKYSHQQKK